MGSSGKPSAPPMSQRMRSGAPSRKVRRASVKPSAPLLSMMIGSAQTCGEGSSVRKPTPVRPNRRAMKRGWLQAPPKLADLIGPKPSAPPALLLNLPKAFTFLLQYPAARSMIQSLWIEQYADIWRNWMDSKLRRKMALRRIHVVWESNQISEAQKLSDLQKFFDTIAEKHSAQMVSQFGPGFT